MSISPEMIHVLKLIESGDDPTWVPLVNGKGSQSRTVGRGATLDAAERAGLIIWRNRHGRVPAGENPYSLTKAGRQEICDEEGRSLERAARKERQALMTLAHWERGYRSHGLWSDDFENPDRLGCVSIGPPGLWDGKTYAWLIDNPKAPGETPLAKGDALSLRDAKKAVELGVARIRRGLPCTQ